MHVLNLINYLAAYGCYALGAALFILDKMSEYNKVAMANPDPKIIFKQRDFWKCERINVIKIALWGIATLILLYPLRNISVEFHNAKGVGMFTLPLATMMLPLYFVAGYSGGRVTMSVAGQYKKTLFDKVGITDQLENKT